MARSVSIAAAMLSFISISSASALDLGVDVGGISADVSVGGGGGLSADVGVGGGGVSADLGVGNGTGVEASAGGNGRGGSGRDLEADIRLGRHAAVQRQGRIADVTVRAGRAVAADVRIGSRDAQTTRGVGAAADLRLGRLGAAVDVNAARGTLGRGTLGVNVSIGRMVAANPPPAVDQPGLPGRTPGQAMAPARAFASADDAEQTRLKRQCRAILADSRSYERDLVALCAMLTRL